MGLMSGIILCLIAAAIIDDCSTKVTIEPETIVEILTTICVFGKEKVNRACLEGNEDVRNSIAIPRPHLYDDVTYEKISGRYMRFQ